MLSFNCAVGAGECWGQAEALLPLEQSECARAVVL